jgi:Rieske Fe-S protein
MRLEVIAEDTFFSPWEDSFTVETNKKVTVEVLSSTKSPIKESAIKVKVNKVTPIVEEVVEEKPQPVKKQIVKEVKRLDPHSTLILRLLEKKGINQNNISENLDVANKLVNNYSKKYNINNPNQLLITVLNNVN